MRKIKRLAVVSAAVLAITGLLTGCGGSTQPVEDDKNAPLSVKDISSGIYVMSADGKFYYPNTEGQNFSGEVTSAQTDRIVYSRNDSKYIPTLYKDDKLVMFTTSEIPETMGVEKFADAGYTYGLYRLSQGNNGSFSFTDDNFINGSTLQASFNEFLGDSGVANIVTVGDKNLTSLDLTDAGTIKCSELGEKKTLSFMKGTFYSEVEAIADEHVWYSDETSCIPDYEMTKNGFIILTLPDSIKDGDYFSVMNTGLILKSGDNRPTEKEESK